jgi:GTP-binding protein
MLLKSAVFVKSSKSYKECPSDLLPEYAFIGRSNVGKSSLINMLTDRRTLAKTSSTPGKTQLINHFLINDAWYLVDLPGIGYARVAHKEQKSWGSMISDYLIKREPLINTFMLLDARLTPQKIDLDFMNNMVINGVPFSMVFTKTDKLKPRELERNMKVYEETLLEIWEYLPEVFLTSASNKIGGGELLAFIGKNNAMALKNSE